MLVHVEVHVKWDRDRVFFLTSIFFFFLALKIVCVSFFFAGVIFHFLVTLTAPAAISTRARMGSEK